MNVYNTPALLMYNVFVNRLIVINWDLTELVSYVRHTAEVRHFLSGLTSPSSTLVEPHFPLKPTTKRFHNTELLTSNNNIRINSNNYNKAVTLFRMCGKGFRESAELKLLCQWTPKFWCSGRTTLVNCEKTVMTKLWSAQGGRGIACPKTAHLTWPNSLQSTNKTQ